MGWIQTIFIWTKLVTGYSDKKMKWGKISRQNDNTKKQREKYLKCCKTHTFWDEIEVLKFYYRKAYIKLKLLSRKHLLSEIPRFMNRLLPKSPETSADGTKTEVQNWLVITVLHYRITEGPMLGVFNILVILDSTSWWSCMLYILILDN